MQATTYDLTDIDLTEWSVKLDGTVLDHDGDEADLDVLAEDIQVMAERVAEMQAYLTKLRKMVEIANG